ncbi:MAG TPA: precorrin-2 C(20)-methyltransferase [Desulfurivibrionaceae bacterium]|nr:precorrin-2 C(20)-methyltransferase [Desulfurivibrionaceae bacterium]
MSGRIAAVGVGPGDPELLTRKAERLIREADVICAPTGAEDATSYALSIVAAFVDRERQEIIPQTFPMLRGAAALEPHWQKAADEVLQRVDAGKRVVFITIGDPCLYSTFLYLYRIFRRQRPEVPVEIVPGISSINAAAAVARVPLGLADDRLTVIPATGPETEVRAALEAFDTVVLMKVSRVFDRLYAMLRELGLADNAVFVRRVGSPQEEVVTDLASLVGTDLDYLSLLIVRKQPLF